MSYEQQLQTIGLTHEQALVYETLLEHGTSTARSIVQKTGLKRGMAYKTLEQLEEMGLVEKHEKEGSITKFSPTDPHNLENLLRDKEQEIEHAKNTLDSTLGELVSDFNLLSGKPNVQYFEGAQGMKKVLWDTLKAKETIYSYADLESILKNIPKINEEYTKLRDERGIMKKGLLLDTRYAREAMEGYHSETTEAKFISPEVNEFGTVVQIYDNKVSYITFKEESMIGIIIEDAYIYTFHRKLFEYVWNITPEN